MEATKKADGAAANEKVRAGENQVGRYNRRLRLENETKAVAEGLAPPQAKRPPLSEEQRALAEQYLPLAKSLAKPLKVCWPLEADEFDSAAQLALVEAAQSYDGTHNVKFPTFARYRIWGALRDVQRGMVVSGWRKDLQNAPKITSISVEAEENGQVVGGEPDAPVGTMLEAFEHVESLLKKLPKRHAEACRQIYLNGLSHGEAADALGCSKSRLSYLHKESLEFIQAVYQRGDRNDRLNRRATPLSSLKTS